FPLAGARAAVVTLEREADPTAGTSAPFATLREDPVAAQDLKAVAGPLRESPTSRDQTAPRFGEAAAAAIGVAQERLPGTWEIRPSQTQGTVHLRLVEVNSSSGTNVPIERLEGLTAAQLAGAGGPVQFRVRRDAGIFTFEGVIRNGVGAGTFSFASDQNFPAELAKRGFARPSAEEQYQ